MLCVSLLASRNWAGLGCSSEGLPLYHCDARENEYGEGQICFYFQEFKKLSMLALAEFLLQMSAAALATKVLEMCVSKTTDLNGTSEGSCEQCPLKACACY